MSWSAVLTWLCVLGIFVGSILLMLALGYVVSSLFRWQQNKLHGSTHEYEEEEE